MAKKLKLKCAYAKDGVNHYIADDGTWDGTQEDAQRFLIVDISYDLNTYDEDSDPVEEFKKRGIEVER